MRGSRRSHHHLSSGMVVSGQPEQYSREKLAPVGSFAVPYTGGDVKKSNELGKMVDVSAEKKPGNSGRISRPSSGPQAPRRTSSGSIAINLPATGLITGGAGRRSGGEEEDARTTRRKKAFERYGSSVSTVAKENYRFRVSRTAMGICGVVLFFGVTVGVFMMVAVKSAMILAAMAGLALLVAMVVVWNVARRKQDLEAFLREFPDTNLHHATHGQFVKVTGVVTCGSIPLETSYQGLTRCVYVCTELHEYRGWRGRPANPRHKRFTWGLRHAERHAADFYISDYQCGARALVRAGHGVKVVPFVKPTTRINMTEKNKEPSSASLSWLEDHHLSRDDRVMRIEEGFIKEASMISVMGTLQSQDNVMMIVPPSEPISTGFQWKRCLFPIQIQGLVLLGDENPTDEVIMA